MEAVISGTAPTGDTAIQARAEYNRASQLLQRGQVGEAMDAFKSLASHPPGAAVPALVGLDSSRVWVGRAFAEKDWDGVVEGERWAVMHLDALRSNDPRLLAGDATTADRGSFAAMAAYALARQGSVESAVSVLEKARLTMFTRSVGHDGDEGPAPLPAGADRVVHLIATDLGGVALLTYSGGAEPPLWLDDLGTQGFQEKVAAYAAAFDVLRRNAALGIKGWKAQVAAMVDLLRASLDPLLVDLGNGAAAVVPVGVLSLLPISGAAVDPATPDRCITILPSARLQRSVDGDHEIDRLFSVYDPSLVSSGWEVRGAVVFFAESSSAPTRREGGVGAGLAAGRRGGPFRMPRYR